MPANVESMMYAGAVPWHRQGTRLDNPATASEAMTSAGLDWDVQKQPLYTGPSRDILIKDRHVVCRMDRLDQPDGGQLGVVGRDYQPLQNREAFGFLDPVVGEGEAIYHTAGAIRKGRQVWMLAKLPGIIRVAGDDITEKYVLLSNSHDGSSAVRIGLTPIRVVCQNTLNLALRHMDGLVIRHDADVAARVRAAHRLLGFINTQLEVAGTQMQRMAATPMAGTRLRDYFEGVLPMSEVTEQNRLIVGNRHNRWSELFSVGEGNSMPGVRGSLFAAYNAITQWVDRESYTPRHKEPLRSIWFGQGARLKQQAFAVAERILVADLN